MRVCWLRQGSSTQVIVIFGGWAVGPEVFAHLDGAEDLLYVSDYRDLAADLPDLSSYDRCSLVAWSFGVASYGHWQQGRVDPFHHKVAVSGALTPVSREFGIPPVVMQKTIDTLTHDSYQIFLKRVFGRSQPVEQIDVAARQDELRAVAARGAAPDPGFDRVWIAGSDRIFPAVNLRRAWEGQMSNELAAPHMPFNHFDAWQEILR